MRTLRLLLLLLLPANLSLFCWAQIDRAEINGTVTDQSGAAISGAQVELVESGTGAKRSAQASDRGAFVLSSLPVGRFTMTIITNGFSPLRIAEIDLHAGDVRTINGKLAVSSVNQTLQIDAGQLNKDDATFGGTVQQVQISRLPLNGRNISNLEVLAPGAIDSGTGTQASIRFAGQGIDDNNYRFDGVDASGILRQAVKSGLRLQFSTEAVAEFKVDASAYTADTGGSAGGQISLISKSGSNSFHGSVFDYLRNSYFDASQPIKTAAATNHIGFHLNQFGGSLGGPIVHNRTFFFVDYEGFRQTLGGVPQNGLVPSPAFRAQLVAAQPELAGIVNAYPQGTAPTSDPNAYAYTGLVPSPDNENSGVVRIDHTLSGKDSAYVRYNIDDGIMTVALNAIAQPSTVVSRIQNAVIEESHLFSPRLVNEAEFGFNRNTYIQAQHTGLPYNFSITGFTTILENYSKEQAQQAPNGNDTVTWTKGQHTIKFGVDIRHPMINEQNAIDGTAAYTSEANFLANKLNTLQVTAALPDKGLRKTQYAGYVQDQWKATRDFTLNAGIRYTYFSPFHLAKGIKNPFDIASCGGYCGYGAEFTFPNYLNFDPRVGLAYSPSSLRGNTVLRAGFGVYHGEDQLGDEDSPVVNTEPSTTLTSSKTTIYSYPNSLALIPTTGLATTPRSLARHHPDSYTQQWTASVQQALGPQTTLTATYLGIKGTHLFRRSYTNTINPATGLRPLPQFPSQIDTKFNAGKSIFHAVQVNVNRRFHNGFFMAGNYMYSHALDDGSVGAGEAIAAQNVQCFACEYASSDYDVRHTGNISMVYDLPFGAGRQFLDKGGWLLDEIVGGWSVDDLFTARAGIPLNVTVSRSASVVPDGNSQSAQRPNRVQGVPIYPANRNVGDWINPAAFVAPAAGTFGSDSRNIANGPPLWQNDVATEKSFRLTERNQLIFRAEAFNVFNRAQYGGVATTFGTGNFGHVTSTVNSAGLVGTGTPRILEFALRLTY